jgi:cysteine-rich repeat protein
MWTAVALGVVTGCSSSTNPGTGGGGSSSSSSSSSGTGGTGGVAPVCGDGKLAGTEACDDGNTAADDGCDGACAVEHGWTCDGASPTVCAETHGDGVIVGAEACDDGNTTTGDGCDATGKIEAGYDCTGAPSVCAPICGDGLVVGAEKCDDKNTVDGDGCDAKCAVVEAGWTCDAAMPTVCAPIPGDGVIVGAEECDDNNTIDGDGCSATQKIEAGWYCAGAPSVCTTQCGDGIIAGTEVCDDLNTADGDGCSATCTIEHGFYCSGAPSICATQCGDGLIGGAEVCDDLNTASGDGCSATCAPETGWTCTGEASTCVTTCGDGIIAGAEVCDDANAVAGDGCDASCKPEAGWTCAGMPSSCHTTCGDGVIAGLEKCDDGNTAAGDGCNATCGLEAGWVCAGAPSSCHTVCGDGVIAGLEACDDTNGASGDGCSAACTVELGFNCTGAPSLCVTTCGDGIPAGAETCDDGNNVAGDGCDAACATETGYGCSGAPSVCAPVCGDGIKLAAEKCDDGNVNNGDCCSSTCQVEAGCEIEPNDTVATANDFAALSVGSKIKGFILPTTDKDVFKVTIPTGTLGTITAATQNGPLGTLCSSNKMDSYLSLYNSTSTVALVTNDDFGGNYCSSVTKSGLIPGDYFVEVRRSTSGNATFDYTLQITTVLAICGNGILETGEQCDDGNSVSGDGCSSTCQLEAHPETEPNDACGAATANGPYTLPPNVLISGGINPSGEQDWFRIVLTNYSDLRLETFDATGPGSCATTTDTKIQLFNSACAAVGALDDDSGIGYCSLLDPTVSTQSFMKHLAPGTYYVQVIPYSSSTTAFNYTLLASLTAFCGNGIVEGGEQCDGTANCQADCTVIPTCGDGIKSGGEQCDDGNAVSGDGCSSTCQLEGTQEVEPNGTTAQADAALPAITGTTRIIGAIGAASDQDLFKITVATQQVVRFEIFDSTAADCVGMNTMYLYLLNSSGTTITSDLSSSGIGVCPELAVNLAPGNYYIRAQQSSTSLVPQYVLDIKFSANDGTETEPNNTQATANAEAGTEFFVCADHQVGTDLDVFAVTVPQGKSVRAEVVEVATTATGYETCESLGIDSYLTLYSPTYTSLAGDDDSGRGFCSQIDGTGAAPSYTGAHNLAAGTYYLEVKQSSLASATGGVFNYCLAVTIR